MLQDVQSAVQSATSKCLCLAAVGHLLSRRCKEQISDCEDEISRLVAKQAVADKALDMGASQVSELKEALEEQAAHLTSSESARSILKAGGRYLLKAKSLALIVLKWTSPCRLHADHY